MSLTTSLVFGFFGSFLMFIGDMVLYYDKNDYDDSDTLNSIIAIMKNINKKRLYIGGILGPISAFIYLMGFYHIVLFSKNEFLIFSYICFFVNSFGIVLGGAYHSHCAYLGLLSRYDNKEMFNSFIDYLKLQAKILYPILALGSLLLALLFILNFTIFPRFMFLFSPIVLIMFIKVVGKLPKGFHMIIRGGWTNLIYVIYYLALILYTIIVF